ncbi:MAG TPA: branched-chain amino acid transaminase [Candidatus Angelobacter sp.]
MSIQATEKIWHNGKFIPWNDAQIHIMSHVVNYGSSVFEGIRCYVGPDGPAIFRLREHMRRLLDSAKIYRIDLDYSLEQLCDAACHLVAVNRLWPCYLRPVVMRGYGEVGVDPFHSPIEVYMCNYPWGKYLGEGGVTDGVDVCVSSWTRIAPNTMPTMAKSGANYMNSQLIKMEAVVNGYVEGIALDVNGYVCEASGANIFIHRKGKLITPPLGNSILPGITRDAVFKLAEDIGVPVIEQMIPREMLYVADEVFFCGTASEITPIRSIDRIAVNNGQTGPVTLALQHEFFGIVNGSMPDRHDWFTKVRVGELAKQPVVA